MHPQPHPWHPFASDPDWLPKLQGTHILGRTLHLFPGLPIHTMEYLPHPSHMKSMNYQVTPTQKCAGCSFGLCVKVLIQWLKKLKVVFGRPLLANGSSCTFPEEMQRLAGWASHIRMVPRHLLTDKIDPVLGFLLLWRHSMTTATDIKESM